MGKPFAVGRQPAAKNHGDGPTKPAVNEATTAKKAEGKRTLMEAAAETMAPDYEVGSAAPQKMDPDQQGEGTRPTYEDRIPWPPAKTVAHKPFKL
jgi:hypothetical protein